MSSAQDMLERLLATGVSFKPETAVESARVQRMLMAMGFVWRDGDTAICEHDNCMTRGLHAQAGRLSIIRENETGLVRYESCKALLSLDIEDVMGVSTLPLMRAFRHVAAKQRVIEGKLDRLLAVLEPQTIGKPPVLRKSGSAKP